MAQPPDPVFRCHCGAKLGDARLQGWRERLGETDDGDERREQQDRAAIEIKAALVDRCDEERHARRPDDKMDEVQASAGALPNEDGNKYFAPAAPGFR
jgi:hypothetical protein